MNSIHTSYSGSLKSLITRQDKKSARNVQIHLNRELIHPHGDKTEVTEIMKSVVGIFNPTCPGIQTGFIVSKEGYVLTNWHVIKTPLDILGEQIYVAMHSFPQDDKVFTSMFEMTEGIPDYAQILIQGAKKRGRKIDIPVNIHGAELEYVDHDAGHDLCLLKIKLKKGFENYLKFSSKSPERGDEVVLFSHHGQRPTIVASPGEVLEPNFTNEKASEAYRFKSVLSFIAGRVFSGDIGALKFVDYLISSPKTSGGINSIETSTISFPGNSGGALCNTKANVIGVLFQTSVDDMAIYPNETTVPDFLIKKHSRIAGRRIDFFGFHKPVNEPTPVAVARVIKNEDVFPLLFKNNIKIEIDGSD